MFLPTGKFFGFFRKNIAIYVFYRSCLPRTFSPAALNTWLTESMFISCSSPRIWERFFSSRLKSCLMRSFFSLLESNWSPFPVFFVPCAASVRELPPTGCDHWRHLLLGSPYMEWVSPGRVANGDYQRWNSNPNFSRLANVTCKARDKGQ